MSYTVDGLVLWPLLPNWKRSVAEALEFRTRVLGPTMTGMRQKRRMRIAPRRSFTFEVHPHHASRRLLDNLRFSQGKREWAMPVWPDRQSLAAALPAGSLSIPCNTDGYDFAPGRYAVLRTNALREHEFEIVQVDSIESGAIYLTSSTVADWPEGSFLYPVRMARMADNSNNAVLLSGEVSTLSVRMEVSEPCDWPEHVFADTYRDRPVWEFDTDWRTNRSFSMNRLITTVDNDTSMPSYFDFPDKTFASLDMLWRAKGRAEHTLVRSALYALAGRYRTLWVPTYTHDLVPVGNIAGTALTVEHCGYTLFALGQEGRQDIRIELNDGTVYYRRVTASVEAGANETLTLDASIGATVNAQQVRRISFLMLMQQSSDSTTLTHLTDADGLATLPVVFESVVDPPEDVVPSGDNYLGTEGGDYQGTESGLILITE